MPRYDDDETSERSSLPELEPASLAPPSTPPGLPNRVRVTRDASVPIITDRQRMDLTAAIALLNEEARCEFIMDVAITTDRAARLYLHFYIAPCEDVLGLTQAHAPGTTRTYQITWRWLRGLVYIDDAAFWLATWDDLDRSVISDADQRFAGSLQGAYVQLAAVEPEQHDAVMTDANIAPRLQTADAAMEARVPGQPASADVAATAPEEGVGADNDGALPEYSLPVMHDVQAPAIAPPLPIYPIASYPIMFGIGIPSFRHFYIGANSERVSVRANWLATDRLMANVDRLAFSPHTPTWAKMHYLELEAKEVITCDASGICGIDYVIRLVDNETIRIRDTCLDWVKGATEAAQRFWRDGHCLRSDIAEQMLHQRPIAYATEAWDAALLEWARRGINIAHVYKVENGSLVAVE